MKVVLFLFTLSKHQITHIYSFGSCCFFLFWIVLVLGRVHSGGKKGGNGTLHVFFCLFSACVVGCWALSNEKHGERGTTHYSIWYSTKRGEGGWCGFVEILFCLLLFTFGRRKQNNAGVRHRFRRVSDSWAQKQDGGRPKGANTCRTFLFVVGIVFFFVSGQENQNLKMCVARRISCTIFGF